ncbi:MAG TPA: hypothetical protein VF682_26020 [Pseudomonas sp.]|jgi:hypothetical protein
MSDFERTFGAGADVMGIIDEINSSFRAERPTEPERQWFETFEEARRWAKTNPGQKFTRHQVSGYEQVVKAETANPAISHIWSIDPDAGEITDTGGTGTAWGYWQRMIQNNEPRDKVTAYLRDSVSMGGECWGTMMDVAQPPLAKVVASLKKVGMGLAPFTKDTCMIERLPSQGDEGENLAVLITEDGKTMLWGYIDFTAVYDALTCQDE